MIPIYKVGTRKVIALHFENDNGFCDMLYARELSQSVIANVYACDILTRIKVRVFNMFYVIVC